MSALNLARIPKKSDYQVKVFTTPKEVHLAIISALKAKLYVDGWQLYDDYVFWLTQTKELESLRVALAYVDNEPIGIAVVQFHSANKLYGPKNSLKVFVKDQYRRQGIATDMALAARPGHNFEYGVGCDGSENFFAKMRELCEFDLDNFIKAA